MDVILLINSNVSNLKHGHMLQNSIFPSMIKHETHLLIKHSSWWILEHLLHKKADYQVRTDQSGVCRALLVILQQPAVIFRWFNEVKHVYHQSCCLHMLQVFYKVKEKFLIRYNAAVDSKCSENQPHSAIRANWFTVFNHSKTLQLQYYNVGRFHSSLALFTMFSKWIYIVDIVFFAWIYFIYAS